MTWRSASIGPAIVVAWLVGSGKVTLLEGLLIGIVTLLIGWIATPFGKPIRKAIEDWLYEPAQALNQCLGIAHGEGKPYLQRNYYEFKAHGLFPIHGMLYTYRIGIVNRSNKTLQDVEVRLTSLKPCPHDFNATGGHLHWAHDNPEGQSHLIKQSVPPTKQQDHSDARFVDVLLCFWPDNNEERQYMQLDICHIVPGVTRRIANLPYELIVTANDQEQALISCTLRFNPLGDGPPTLKLDI
jgi:hypothetical protein